LDLQHGHTGSPLVGLLVGFVHTPAHSSHCRSAGLHSCLPTVPPRCVWFLPFWFTRTFVVPHFGSRLVTALVLAGSRAVLCITSIARAYAADAACAAAAPLPALRAPHLRRCCCRAPPHALPATTPFARSGVRTFGSAAALRTLRTLRAALHCTHAPPARAFASVGHYNRAVCRTIFAPRRTRPPLSLRCDRGGGCSCLAARTYGCARTRIPHDCHALRCCRVRTAPLTAHSLPRAAPRLPRLTTTLPAAVCRRMVDVDTKQFDPRPLHTRVDSPTHCCYLRLPGISLLRFRS